MPGGRGAGAGAGAGAGTGTAGHGVDKSSDLMARANIAGTMTGTVVGDAEPMEGSMGRGGRVVAVGRCGKEVARPDAEQIVAVDRDVDPWRPVSPRSSASRRARIGSPNAPCAPRSHAVAEGTSSRRRHLTDLGGERRGRIRTACSDPGRGGARWWPRRAALPAGLPSRGARRKARDRSKRWVTIAGGHACWGRGGDRSGSSQHHADAVDVRR